jgi:P-type Ca2+ transporter type 2C
MGSPILPRAWSSPPHMTGDGRNERGRQAGWGARGPDAGDGDAWHARTPADTVRGLVADAERGLTSAEARLRRSIHGENRLEENGAAPAWMLFLQQFKGLLILVLIGAAGLAAAIGDLKDAVVILAVVALNAVLAFVQEYRAGQAIAALKEMLAPTARVRRDGDVHEIAAAELVPGDLVLLEAGDRAPADGRLVLSRSLEIDESSLTGESHPVGKIAEAVVEADSVLPDRVNMAYMNTSVTRGRGEILVTATGMRTEMGRIAAMMQAAEPDPTPLQVSLDRLGRRLAAIAVGVIAAMLGVELWRGADLGRVALTSIALAVAAIPEGLPAVVTVTLALGMRRMAASRAIVRRLASVETLGATTVICSDKTGTLTLNQMTARRIRFRGGDFEVTGEGSRSRGEIRPLGGSDAGTDLSPLLLPLALCNDSRLRDGEAIGDPTEAALLALAVKGGIDPEASGARFRRIAEVPFDSAHRFMATFHFDGDRVRLFVKGAPDALLPRCTAQLGRLGEEGLDGSVVQANDEQASRALRVLAVASRTLAASEFDPAGDLFRYVEDLVLVGLVGLMDPPRPEAREAIALCRRAGIEVKMITGDQSVTAAAIAKDLGLEGAVVTGAELDAIPMGELADCVRETAVFARVAPKHKVLIVQALKQSGHVVAMTGDGVNDAPSLRTADIGVAMGRTGTEVTKEAAAIVLTDDNFATIVGAVEAGRTIYDNIGKFVRFQLSTNFGALLSVFAAPLVGLPVPFDPVQLLWVNIIMDGPPAMALGADPGRPGIMDAKPRPRDAPILSLPRLRRLIGLGLIMATGTLAVLRYGLETGDPEHARTLAFTTFVGFQLFNAFNVRSEIGTVFERYTLSNRSLWFALAAVLALQVLATNWKPAQVVFDTVGLSAADGVLAIAVASSIVVVEEAGKALVRHSQRHRSRAGRP